MKTIHGAVIKVFFRKIIRYNPRHFPICLTFLKKYLTPFLFYEKSKNQEKSSQKLLKLSFLLKMGTF